MVRGVQRVRCMAMGDMGADRAAGRRDLTSNAVALDMEEQEVTRGDQSDWDAEENQIKMDADADGDEFAVRLVSCSPSLSRGWWCGGEAQAEGSTAAESFRCRSSHTCCIRGYDRLRRRWLSASVTGFAAAMASAGCWAA
jgi:hypothetical protein